MELADVFAKDPTLIGLAGTQSAAPVNASLAPSAIPSIDADVSDALLSMGFTSQEAELALEGREEAGANSLEAALAYALKRLGKRG